MAAAQNLFLQVKDRARGRLNSLIDTALGLPPRDLRNQTRNNTSGWFEEAVALANVQRVRYEGVQGLQGLLVKSMGPVFSNPCPGINSASVSGSSLFFSGCNTKALGCSPEGACTVRADYLDYVGPRKAAMYIRRVLYAQTRILRPRDR